MLFLKYQNTRNSIGEKAMNEAYKNIISRRSVRSFTGESIDRETLNLVLEAGISAPSAVNKQPWEIFVIEDKKTLEEISNLENFYVKMAKSAGAAIIVCGNLEKALPQPAQEYWVQDASAATENILLAANALGLGAVWTGVYPTLDRAETLSKLLNLPKHIIPLNIIPIGVPANTKHPEKKMDKNCIHFGKYSE